MGDVVRSTGKLGSDAGNARMVRLGTAIGYGIESCNPCLGGGVKSTGSGMAE
jgi:hypothetical protein